MRRGSKILTMGLLCLMGGLAAPGMVWAQDDSAASQKVPEPLLELDHKRCMQDCVPGFGEATCKPLCDCTVNEFRKRLNYSQYLDMSVQLSRGEIKPETRKMLDSVAKYCTAQIDQAGVPVGGPEKGGEKAAAAEAAKDAADPAAKPKTKPDTPNNPK